MSYLHEVCEANCDALCERYDGEECRDLMHGKKPLCYDRLVEDHQNAIIEAVTEKVAGGIDTSTSFGASIATYRQAQTYEGTTEALLNIAALAIARAIEHEVG